MTSHDIIDGIIAKKNELKMTNQQLSDASGVPKTTIDRILRRETPNPSMQTILDMAAAVGYSFSNHPEQHPATPQEIGVKDPMVQYIVNIYERRCIGYEERIKRVTAHFNMLIAEKNRWIKFSLALNIILVVFACSVLLYDLTHLDRGWFQEQMANYSNASFFTETLIAVKDFVLNHI